MPERGWIRGLRPIVLVAAASACAARLPPAPAVLPWPATFGVTLAPVPAPPADGEIDVLAATGANAIAVIPFAAMRDPQRSRIHWNATPRGFWGESERGIVPLARAAHERGIAVLLKPHLWLDRSWPGAVTMPCEAEWQCWFADYRSFLLRWARCAREADIEMLCIGSELDASLGHEREWRALIADVRAVYSGRLTYNANWSHCEDVPFWDALDAIGISAWFPLTSAARPGVDELVACWKPIRQRLAGLAARWSRPVVFTEIGYHPMEGAFARPYETDVERPPLAPEVQAAGYEAVARAFYDEPWFAGALWWSWPLRAGPLHDPPARFRPSGAGYAPHGLAAEEVLRRTLPDALEHRIPFTAAGAAGRMRPGT